MATFSNEKAQRKAVHVRRVLSTGAEVYERLPYDIVRYDDNSGEYVEPVAMLGLCGYIYTWDQANPVQETAEFFITDRPPFNGVTEIR